jgi:hypothetical protein
MKYNQYRSLSEKETPEDRHIFTQERDQIDRKEAIDDVMSHTSSAVNYHKMILSPGDEEHIDDYRQWTRDVMNDLEERKGVKLHWYAVEHHNTDNPHVHVVLAGAGEDMKTGETKTVGMYKDDYQFLREQGREHSNHEFYQNIHQEWQDLDQNEQPMYDKQIPERER